MYKLYESVKNDPRTNALGAAQVIAKAIGSRDLLLRMVADSPNWVQNEYVSKRAEGDAAITDFKRCFQTMLDYYDSLNVIAGKKTKAEKNSRRNDRVKKAKLIKHLMSYGKCPEDLARCIGETVSLATLANTRFAPGYSAPFNAEYNETTRA